MSKRQILMILGVWLAVLLFLGFPSGWEKGIALICGLLVLIISYRIPSRGESSSKGADGSVPFVEHKSDSIIKPSQS